MPFSVGQPSFGLADVKIATWNSAGSYGSAVDVFSVQMMGVNMQTVSAELNGDDQITAIASRAISGSVQLRFGGLSIEALEVLLGITATSSISSPNNIKNFRINGGQDTPYFGLVGRAVSEGDAGDTLIFIPKARIMNEIQLAQLEYGAFVIPQVEARCISDTSYGIINIVTRETASTTVAIPPANIPVNS
jgi:hypothetical protein